MIPRQSKMLNAYFSDVIGVNYVLLLIDGQYPDLSSLPYLGSFTYCYAIVGRLFNHAASFSSWLLPVISLMSPSMSMLPWRSIGASANAESISSSVSLLPQVFKHILSRSSLIFPLSFLSSNDLRAFLITPSSSVPRQVIIIKFSQE